MSTGGWRLRQGARHVWHDVHRAVRGDLDVLDKYFAFVLPAVFAAFYVFDKGPHRTLFYVFALLPMLLYIRRPVLRTVMRTWIWRLGATLCLLWGVSVVWSATMTLESAFDAIRTSGALCLFLTVCTFLATRGRFPEVPTIRAIVLAATVCALLTFVLLAIPGSGYSVGGRLEGFGWADHAGNGGDMYGFAAVLAMVLAVEARSRRMAAAFWSAFAICVVYVLLAESRAPVLGVLVAASVLGAVKSPRSAVAILAVAVVAAMAVNAVGLVDFADWIARGTAYRLELWADAFRQTLENPILGAGGADTGRFVADGRNFNSPHNGLIGMFYYLGVIGGGLFVVLCAYVTRYAARHAFRSGSCLTLAMLAFGFTVLLFHTKTVVVLLNRDWLIFWLPVILVAAMQIKAFTASERRLSTQEGRLLDDVHGVN